MVRLKPDLIKAWPPGGWTYKETATGWEAPTPMGVGFRKQVSNIIEHRRANPRFNLSTDENDAARDLERYTINRLQRIKGAEKYFDSGDPPKNSLARNLAAGVVRLAGVVRTGSAAAKEWLGPDARPVLQEQSDSRARVCLKCPLNQSADWRSLLTGPAGAVLRSYLEVKTESNLRTVYDDDLKVCDACLCPLTLKVWTPIEHIVKHTDAETFDRFHTSCWILSERK